MTTETKARILTRISELETDITALRRVRIEVASSGTASATLSTGDGSKSYTRADIDKITRLISQLVGERAQLIARISGQSAIRQIYFVR